ncbi:hypothetical protein OROGR_026748 [Orobanche gracilis]
MVKRKEVGASGSSKKKMGVSNQRSEVKLKKRRGKIKKAVVNKGKRPIMRFDSTSDSSESDVRVVRKKRKKTSKDADYTEGESETENHTESGNKSEDSVRNAIINDVLEAPTSDYSSESGDDRKTKRLLPTNCFGKLQIEKGITYYRSNLRTATSSIVELTFSAAHLKAMRRIPSWYMFEAIHKHGGERMMSRCDKSDEVIRNILLSYDQDTDQFILGGKEVQLSGRDVALIFGIVGGTKKIPFKKPNSRNSKWVKRNFGKDTESSLNKTRIFNRMASILDRTDETSVEDVARLMHCYLMASVLTPGQSSSVSWYLTDYLEDLEGAIMYDWCGYIAAILRNGIRYTRNLKIGGCAMLLPYWLCEHTCLVKPSRKVLFPRFMKWDLQKLLKRNFRVHLSYVDSSYVTKDLLNPTAEEKKKIRELVGGCGIGSNDHHIRKENFDCETDCGKVDTSAAVCSTDQDMCDEAEDIHPTAELGADSPETHRRRDAAHVDIASSSKTPLKASGGNVVKGDIFQPSSFKNGSTVFRETTIRETAFQESAFGETVIRETTKPETAEGDKAVKDTEPIISSCPSFSLDITQLRTPTQKSVHNDVDEMNSNTNLGKVDPAIDEVDVIIDEWQPQNLDLPEDSDLNINTGGLQLCIRGTDLESTIEKLRLEKELEKAAFEDRLKAFEEQSKRMCELHEARFRAMEEQNRRLLNDNEILRANMVDTSIPTHTQIYSDPKNLEKIDAWTSMHLAKLKNEGKKSKVKSPNSMTKRIKDRTVIGDRKAKDITPPLEKKELKRRTEIQYVEVEEYDKELNVEKVNEKTFKGLDARYHAVSKASGRLRSLVSSHCNNGPASVVWRGLAPLAEVTADDIVSLLHHKPLKGKVIDAWAELMNHKYASGTRSNKITIFTASCWDLIAGNDSCPTGALTHLIDNRLEGSLGNDVLLFPLNTKGSGRITRESGFHWTLLMLDVKNFKWRFFNTIGVRTDKTVDVHLRRSEKVMTYVEDKMKEFYKAMRVDHPFLDNTFTKTEVAECIQQVETSVDCGVIVCVHIENAIRKRSQRKMVFTDINSGTYRKMMTEMFLESDSLSTG